MAASRATVRVGCSGWQYRHWRGDFYPREVPLARWFEHYAGVFDTVELNGTFYRLPQGGTVRKWRVQAPEGFVFAWKASRFLTHMKKLKDAEEPIARMMEVARELGEKLGPILYQLPPHWPVDVARLESFLRFLPRGLSHAFEFREPSWYCEEVYRAIEGHGATVCLHDMPGSESPRRAVGDFVYVRFHGAAEKYRSGYARGELRTWATWLRKRIDEKRAVYAYFNNDAEGHAPKDALTLRELLTP